MDVTKLFNSKKKLLSNNSNIEEDVKRKKEVNPDTSLLETPKTFQDVFEESLKSEVL